MVLNAETFMRQSPDDFSNGFLNLVRSELIALGKHLGLAVNVCIRRLEFRVIVVQHLHNKKFLEADSIEIRYNASSYLTAALKFQDEIKIEIERYATEEACKRMKRIVEMRRQHKINMAKLKNSNLMTINDNSNSIIGDMSSEPDNHPSGFYRAGTTYNIYYVSFYKSFQSCLSGGFF